MTLADLLTAATLHLGVAVQDLQSLVTQAQRERATSGNPNGQLTGAIDEALKAIAAATPGIVVTLEGGVLTNIFTNGPMDVLTIEGEVKAGEAGTCDVRQLMQDGTWEDVERASCSLRADVPSVYTRAVVNARIKMFRQTAGAQC